MNLSLLTHVWNEEILLPHWLEHHLALAETGIIIDHGSTDKTLEILSTLPKGWRVEKTKLEWFDAHLLDEENKFYEEQLTGDWKGILNITEFLWHEDLPGLVKDYGKTYDALGFRAFMMVDNKLDLPLDEKLWKNRTNGYLDDDSSIASRRWRFIHNQPHGQYALGRHGTSIEKQARNLDWNILFAAFAPWPQAVKRKMQVQERIPPHNKAGGLGIQHLQNPETLNNFYLQELSKSSDLLQNERFLKGYQRYIQK